MANLKVEIIGPVTLGYSTIDSGIIELDEVSANALVAEGKAKHVENQEGGNGAGVSGDANTSVDAQKGAKNPADGEDDKLQGVGANNPADEAVALMRKALDDKFKRDELAEAAKAIGVEFAYDAKKAEIVEAVIAAGKAEILVQA
jgi:hypothetical protein